MLVFAQLAHGALVLSLLAIAIAALLRRRPVDLVFPVPTGDDVRTRPGHGEQA